MPIQAAASPEPAAPEPVAPVPAGAASPSPPPSSPSPSRFRLSPGLALGLLAVVSAAVILAVSLLVADHSAIFNSEGFIERSRIPLSDPRFYLAIRPFATDLFFKVFGSDPQRVVYGQMLVNALAWPLLGYCAARLLRCRLLAVACLLMVSSVGLWWNVQGWALVMRSESACFSFFAVWLGLFLLFADTPRWRVLAALVPASLLFSFTRDNIPYLLVMVYFGFVASLALVDRGTLRRRWMPLAVYAVVLAAIFAAQSYTVRHAYLAKDDMVPGRTLEFRTRYEFNLLNVLFKRILPDPVARDWFARHGMPAFDVERWSGRYASDHDWALYADPQYLPLRDFVVEKMRQRLGQFLLTHPRYAWVTPLVTEGEKFWPHGLYGYYYPPEKTGQTAVTAVSWWWDTALGSAAVTVPAGLAVLAFGLIVLGPGRLRPALPGAWLLAGFAAQLFLIYHADAMEVERHLLLIPPGVLVVLLISAFVVADRTAAATGAVVLREETP